MSRDYVWMKHPTPFPSLPFFLADANSSSYRQGLPEKNRRSSFARCRADEDVDGDGKRRDSVDFLRLRV